MSDFCKCEDCSKELKCTVKERENSTSTPLCIRCYKRRNAATIPEFLGEIATGDLSSWEVETSTGNIKNYLK